MLKIARQSQPARAVWIEIINRERIWEGPRRHSLRGLCGLKFWHCPCKYRAYPSQPARAVWIEICSRMRRTLRANVTACEGCVD